jgi:hypothetical protein
MFGTGGKPDEGELSFGDNAFHVDALVMEPLRSRAAKTLRPFVASTCCLPKGSPKVGVVAHDEIGHVEKSLAR